MNQQKSPPIEIPFTQLSEEILQAVAESFVLREGTDYGVTEVPLDKKIEQVLRQIRKKEVLIFFDQDEESVTLIPARSLKKPLIEEPI